MNRVAGPARRGTTLIEIVLFAALGSIVLVGAVGLFTRGTHLLEVSRRESSAQTDLRTMLETMARDLEETLYFDELAEFDSASAAPDTGFRLVTRSSRPELGLEVPPGASKRRVEYRVSPPRGEQKLRDCVRTVSLLTEGGAADTPSGGLVGSALTQSLERLRLLPLEAVPDPALRYRLVAPSDPASQSAAAFAACVMLDVAIGHPAGASSVDRSAATSVTTKLWCRNRLLEMARGGNL